MLNDDLNRTPATRGVRAAAAVALLLTTSAVTGFGARAQSLAMFSGTVFDATNRAVPKATLELTNSGTEAKQTIKSDDAGHFEFVGLPPGDYVLENKTPGFQTQVGALTMVGANVRKDVTLQVGSLMETLTVTDGGAQRPATSARQGPVQKYDLSTCVATQAGGSIRPPRKLRDARPVYPDRLRGTGTSRVVTLEARIGPDGTVVETRPVGDVDPDFTSAAIEAVRQWEFDPTLLSCTPIDVSMRVIVNFAPAPPLPPPPPAPPAR